MTTQWSPLYTPLYLCYNPFMNLSETKKGDLAILGGALLWSLFPILTILSYPRLSPLLALAWNTLFAGIFFGFIMLMRGKLRELAKPGILKYSLIIAFTIGWLYYGLYFSALKFTSAGNASIIALMELFFSYLLFNVWKKERFSGLHTIGAILMVFGAAIILFPKQGLSFHAGDFMVLLATACAPIGNYYQQKLRKIISSETLLFLRNLLTSPFFFLMSWFLGDGLKLPITGNLIWIVAINGMVVLGLSRVMWMEGIHRISVTKANALGSIAPLFTLFFAYLILHQNPTIWQLASFVPLSAGLILLTYTKKIRQTEQILV